MINLKDFRTPDERRRYIEKKKGVSLESIGLYSFDETKILGRNCENLIGATQVPLGLAGPILIKGFGKNSKRFKSYYLPLATTEGALVASVNRGCKATRLSDGVRVIVRKVGATRGPVFRVRSLEEGERVRQWIENNVKEIESVVEKTDRFIRLKEVETSLVGLSLYLRLIYDTAQAMGMNMVTIATREVVQLIEKKLKISCISLSGNYCIDKKAAWINFIKGRGFKVWAEVVVKKRVLRDILKTEAKDLHEVNIRKNYLGSIVSGSLGFNGHFANVVGALFLATGQDVAHVVEGSLGMTMVELKDRGSVHFSVYLPDLMVGTVGGGTGIETQKEALGILGLGKGKKREELEFAGIVGAAVLAGELSLLSALSAGHLVRAHEKLGRGKAGV